MIEFLNSDGFKVITGGIVTIAVAYIANVWSKRVRENKRPDRMDTIYDGYENLIKQQQRDIQRKGAQLDQTQQIIDRLQHELDMTRQIVSKQQKELEQAKEANKDLIHQLEVLKKTYPVPAN